MQSHIKMIHCPCGLVTNLEEQENAFQNESLHDTVESVL